MSGAEGLRMRGPVDGTFMRRLTRTGRWWLCMKEGCKEMRCSDPEVEFGWQLIQGRQVLR